MLGIFSTALRQKISFDLWGAKQRTFQAILTIAIDALVIGTIFTDWGGIADRTTTAAIGGTLYNLGTLSATLGGDPIFYTSRVQFARLTGQDGFTQVIATVPNYSATWRS